MEHVSSLTIHSISLRQATVVRLQSVIEGMNNAKNAF